MARIDLTDFEWSVIRPLLASANARPRADIPARYGPCATCVNRLNRWRQAGHWARILGAVSKAYDGDIQMIDSSSLRVSTRHVILSRGFSTNANTSGQSPRDTTSAATTPSPRSNSPQFAYVAIL